MSPSRGRRQLTGLWVLTLYHVPLHFLLLHRAAVLAMRTTRPWTTQPWCQSVEESGWPFAYSKYINQTLETKGRTSTNLQDMRHDCTWYGVRSKCHRCEEHSCYGGRTSHYQIQGVDSQSISNNIPTISDAPFAVNGSHRYDYGNPMSSHICLMISGGLCLSPFGQDYSNCSLRCWGYGFSGSQHQPQWFLGDETYGINASNPTATAVWNYPKKYSALGNTSLGAPLYNPQGYARTVAGGGQAGFKDGHGASAKFRYPQGVAVDRQNNVYIADTGNHCIRKLFPNGTVITIAGTGRAGHKDGMASKAEFSSPSSLTVYYDDIFGYSDLVIFVADTGNHRIRRLDGPHDGQGFVSCFSGQCGNGTISETVSFTAAEPGAGYADGEGDVARFDSPKGIASTFDGWLYVADTNNHLIRTISPNGTTYTLAGNLQLAETNEAGEPLEGCVPPCLRGVPGHRDGNLTHAQFYYPSDVAIGQSNSVIVTDQHRLRLVSLPGQQSMIQGIQSMGWVFTLAGQRNEGENDGKGQEAEFNMPTGVTMSLPDGVMYVADAVSCRIRRISPASYIAFPINCTTRAVDVVRPSGCQSYDPPVDLRDKTVSAVFGNIYYNYAYRNLSSVTDGYEPVGRRIYDCVGSPPVDRLDKQFWNVSGGNLVVDDGQVDIKEDTGDGTTIRVSCPALCMSAMNVRGTGFYSDDSNICQAAVHAGVINASEGGLVLISLERGILSLNMTAGRASFRNGIQTEQIPYGWPRVFKVHSYPEATVGVQTISGHPAALLSEACGKADGQPAQEAKFNMPSGLALYINSSLNDSTMLYVADTNNHRIVAISAVCSFTCENMGRCIGPDRCECAAGWTGQDCTKPVCSSSCGLRQICVAPDTCGCIPGYSGYPNCKTALCVQTCHNGGSCTAPDTCSCSRGWFDSNCTTPVCLQTCGNGGQCVTPNTCRCPTDWTGNDCRIPTCKQTCLNGGHCTAPNTCTCPPQWSGHDCSLPVCMQGFFEPNPSAGLNGASGVSFWETYVPCTIEAWCNVTNEFDCAQLRREYLPLEIPSGAQYRNATGRTSRPTQCTFIELERDAISPFQYVQADNTTTKYARYSPRTPYAYDSNPKWPWSAYLGATDGRTLPWTWDYDRQVALIEWRNVTQGVYVCANGGNCTAPDICQCAPGWIGFDCRTPVCTQGYYNQNQKKYVTGSGTNYEIAKFDAFMSDKSVRLAWPYSNPNYTLVREAYINSSYLQTYTTQEGDIRYLSQDGYQGGYRCSIRAWTEWENENFVFQHPNFYSRYMDPKTQSDGKNYTFWNGMDWNPVYQKTAQLFFEWNSVAYTYTNQGWRKEGIWLLSGKPWAKGSCILEFNRTCPSKPEKALDLLSMEYNVLVQDTDHSYRQQVNYTIWKVEALGRWSEEGGECIDEVIRGCHNNGTCIAPDVCRCADGWTGSDCSIPVCIQTCRHNGNCTLPNTCTCERGWSGLDCSIPLCAQECNNGGYCIAPDVCKCVQWPSEYEDGRLFGGRPLYRKPNGDCQNTGWTGYDCSTPICVQGTFLYNTRSNLSTTLGGHGSDGSLTCDSVRCPVFDAMVTQNDGRTFQTGCGYDPLDTGCCFESVSGATTIYTCYRCANGYRVPATNNFTCRTGGLTTYTYAGLTNLAADFLTSDKKAKICGKVHSPSSYYNLDANRKYWSQNYKSNLTSDRFLCNVLQWEQGDYVDHAGFEGEVGVGTDYGLASGRHVRVNYPNITRTGLESWSIGEVRGGEGIYSCPNGGSCIAPDRCTCADGWSGYDCSIPSCRHLQVDGRVSRCENGGVCVNKDDCHCIQSRSLLADAHPTENRGLTGWSGTDCSMPICVQGYYDPFCTDLPQAPGYEGCYRCANGGNCTAPDFCQCAEGWTGYDCRTPVCEAVATVLTRKQLATVDEEKVHAFESNPCSLKGVYVPDVIGGVTYYRGNCTAPFQCTCLCKNRYSAEICEKYGDQCDGAWQDPMVRRRNVLPNSGYTFGTRECVSGYEGHVDDMDRWTSCHLKIMVPNTFQRYTRIIIVVSTLVAFFGLIAYNVIRRRLKRKYLLAKIERRRSRRSSEDSATVRNRKNNAFRNR